MPGCPLLPELHASRHSGRLMIWLILDKVWLARCNLGKLIACMTYSPILDSSAKEWAARLRGCFSIVSGDFRR